MGIVRRSLCVLALALAFAGPASAADKAVIDARVQAALVELRGTVPGASDILAKGKGVLVMPAVTKGGLIVGAYYGEGALQIDGATVDYYSVAGGSLGLLAGLETSSQVLVFLTDEALAGFRAANGWEIGANANVTVLQAGAAGSVDTTVTNQPIVAFVFGQTGLMAGVGLDGAKYSRIER